MRDVSAQLYRFACPICSHILKAPSHRAGRGGVCPSCKGSIVLPGMALSPTSWTLAQISAIISRHDLPVEPQTLDRVGLLLAQGTCLEYVMAREQLPAWLSARQWRNLLKLAASRELIRLDVVRKVHCPDLTDTLSFCDDHSEPAAQHAWTLMARYLHFNRHSTCAECTQDRTGMSCIYQSFPRFTPAATWDEPRQEKWRAAIEQSLCLASRISL